MDPSGASPCTPSSTRSSTRRASTSARMSSSVAAFSTTIVAIDRHVLTLPHVQAAPLAVFGVALSLFLGFRNNAAYDRWWEEIVPALENENQTGPRINPFETLYWEQFGGGPDQALLDAMDPSITELRAAPRTGRGRSTQKPQ